MEDERAVLDDKVGEAVLNYLVRKNVNYGIMLTGKWGCGKTFYWKNVLEPRIKAKDLFPLYVSVNGLTSSEAVARKILMGLAKVKSKGIVSEKVTTVLENIAAVANTVMDYIDTACEAVKKAVGLGTDLLNVNLKADCILDIFDFSGYVICIDDVERYGGEMEELMGFCNNLLEHRKAHLVFIANEEKMRDRFRTLKEKVIGKTVHCNLDPYNIVWILLDQAREMNPHAIDVMKENIDVILDVLFWSGERNYRTVKVLIGDFQELYEKMERLSYTDEELRIAERALLKFTMAAGIEILAKGTPLEEIEELRDPSCAGLRKLVPAVGGKDRLKQSYVSSFKSRYYKGYPLEREFFPSVISFLTEGVVDIEALNKELMLFHKNEPSLCDLILSGQFREMDDGKFNQEVKGKMLEDIENGNIHLKYYRRLFMRFVMFIQSGILDMGVQELKEKFLIGLGKIKESDTQELPEWNARDICAESWFMESDPADFNAYMEINKAVNDTASHLMRDMESVPNCFIEELRSNFQYAMTLAGPDSNGKCLKGSLFSDVHPEDVYDILKQQTNKDIQSFRQMIESRPYYANKNEGDDRFLLELAKLIRERLYGVRDKKLSEGILMELASDIERSRGNTQPIQTSQVE